MGRKRKEGKTKETRFEIHHFIEYTAYSISRATESSCKNSSQDSKSRGGLSEKILRANLLFREDGTTE